MRGAAAVRMGAASSAVGVRPVVLGLTSQELRQEGTRLDTYRKDYLIARSYSKEITDLCIIYDVLSDNLAYQEGTEVGGRTQEVVLALLQELLPLSLEAGQEEELLRPDMPSPAPESLTLPIGADIEGTPEIVGDSKHTMSYYKLY